MKVNNRGIFVNVREPILHWNNFTVQELREILDHCMALERLGISQNEEMMTDIERDLVLREKEFGRQEEHGGLKRANMKQHTVQDYDSTQRTQQEDEDNLLEQTV